MRSVECLPQNLLMILLGIVISMPIASAQDTSLVAYYPFNGNADDQSGNGNHGTPFGVTYVNDRFGISESACSFDGYDDYVVMAESTNLDGFYAFTISIWFSPSIELDPSIGRKDLLYKSPANSSNHSYYLVYGDNVGNLGFLVHEHADYNHYGVVVYEHVFNANQWYHTVITYDGDSTLTMYVDAQSVGMQTASTLRGQIRDTSEPLWVGRHWSEIYYFPGVMDDVRIFSRKLETYEIEDLYHEGGWPPCPYLPGDINNNGDANGVDVTYAVNYLKGIGPQPPIECPDCPNPGETLFAAGDVNGNCQFNGVDVTYFVNYLKGIGPALAFCPNCPPAGR